MGATSSNTETAVHDNHLATQALSSPIRNIHQAIPIVQQQIEGAAANTVAVHDIVRDSHQDILSLREAMLEEFGDLSKLFEKSQEMIPAAVAMRLDSLYDDFTHLRQAGMDNLSQKPDEMKRLTAQVEAVVSITVDQLYYAHTSIGPKYQGPSDWPHKST